jgi:hypothetical protein
MRRLVVTTIALVCLALAGPASAAPRSFYGVVTAKDPSSAEFAKMGGARVGTMRIAFSWESVQHTGPDQPYDWSRYDQIIGNAAQEGVRVLPTIFSSPGWAADKPSHPPKPAFRDEYQAFVRAAAERYGSNGLFWTLNPLTPKVPIIDWQPWNEVNSPTFWLPKPNPKQYKQLLVATNAGLAAGDPKARVMLAGLFRSPRIKNGVFMVKYLKGLYKAKARGLFDSVAVHPYAPTPKRALNAVLEARRVMSRFKDKRKPIWLTEVGWATPPGQKTPLTVSRKKQAKLLTQTYKLMNKNRKRHKIGGVLWYSFKDLPTNVWFDNTGLFTSGGAPKPSWNAFARVAGGSP